MYGSTLDRFGDVVALLYRATRPMTAREVGAECLGNEQSARRYCEVLVSKSLVRMLPGGRAPAFEWIR